MSKLNLTWQYNGCATWDDIVAWCHQNIKDYSAHNETIWFYTEADKTMFLLRWA